jgi:hypothetical protein
MRLMPIQLVFVWICLASATVGATPLQQPEAAAEPGCAVFGADLAPKCESFPVWPDGAWTPPKGAEFLRILDVGGGGGGGGSIERGIGGAGGSSGAVVTTSLTNDGLPVLIRVGQGGRGGRGYNVPGRDGSGSQLGGTVAIGGSGGGHYGAGESVPGEGRMSGGDGGGGGYYGDGQHGGAGGDGGYAGGRGAPGSAGADSSETVGGTRGGTGQAFPHLAFDEIDVSAGVGGKGGRAAPAVRDMAAAMVVAVAA